jgi:hypothetical protein
MNPARQGPAGPSIICDSGCASGSCASRTNSVRTSSGQASATQQPTATSKRYVTIWAGEPFRDQFISYCRERYESLSLICTEAPVEMVCEAFTYDDADREQEEFDNFAEAESTAAAKELRDSWKALFRRRLRVRPGSDQGIPVGRWRTLPDPPDRGEVLKALEPHRACRRAARGLARPPKYAVTLVAVVPIFGAAHLLPARK